MRITVIGTGYVGLVSGVCLAEIGHEVACVDVDAGKVARIQDGAAPFFEAGLDDLLQRHVGKALRATTDLRSAMHGAQLSLIAVGTPFDGREIDLSFVKAAARAIGEQLRERREFHAVVVRSTVVPGTTEEVVGPMVEEASGKRAGRDFGIAMNPEFLTEGEAVADFMRPDRIVFGAGDDRTSALLRELYRPFTGVPVIETNPRTAEMIKYASNAMLATAISFMNELGNISAAVGGIDIVDVARGLHASRYLTVTDDAGRRRKAPIASFYEAGCGYGGSCLPKDVKALISHATTLGVAPSVLQAVETVNASQPHRLVDLTRSALGGQLRGRTVTVLGVAFKPDTSDTRQSPAFPVVQGLIAGGARVRLYDPVVFRQGGEAGGSLQGEVLESLEDAVSGTDALVLVTRWSEFARLPELIAAQSTAPVLVDGRRVIEPESVPRYHGIGRA